MDTMTGVVKVVTHGGRARVRCRVIYGRLLPGSLKIAEIGVTARFPVIVKDLIPGMGAKSFAIMKGRPGMLGQRALGAGVTIYAAPG
jgi:hypothetical protein